MEILSSFIDEKNITTVLNGLLVLIYLYVIVNFKNWFARKKTKGQEDFFKA